MSATVQAHWDSIYSRATIDELPWHEPVPSTLALVVANSSPDDPVIDVGAGASTLPIELVRRGYHDVTVLDISEHALSMSRSALWQHRDAVEWIHADVVGFRARRRWRLWHDRAVFHFLVSIDDRDEYRVAAASAVRPGGVLIVSTFAPDGPERCAGLPVRRYDVIPLAAAFAPEFELVDGRHLTPPASAGDQRPYVAVVMRRR